MRGAGRLAADVRPGRRASEFAGTMAKIQQIRKCYLIDVVDLRFINRPATYDGATGRNDTMEKKPTVTGVMVFVGLLVGVIGGLWLPYIPSLEALAGGIIGAVIGFAIDKKNAVNS